MNSISSPVTALTDALPAVLPFEERGVSMRCIVDRNVEYEPDVPNMVIRSVQL